MAIAVEQVQAWTEGVASGSTLTFDASPAGWSTPTSGNMILGFIYAANQTDSIQSPSGWTEIGTFNTSRRMWWVGWKESDGTESSWTFGRTETPSPQAEQCGMVAYELSGVDITAGTAQFSYQNYGVTSATSRAFSTSITPSVNDAIFIAFWDFEDNDASAYTYSNSYTVGDYFEDATNAPDNSIGAGYKIISDGLFHTTTVAVNAGGADQNAGVHIVVDAESTGGFDLDGALFSSTNTFPTGVLTPSYDLDGVLFASTNTFPAGQLDFEVPGTLFASTNTFTAGAISFADDSTVDWGRFNHWSAA